MEKYFLLLKTGAAEMRAYANLRPTSKRQITPIIELTRGRKNHKTTAERTGELYNFEAVVDFVSQQISLNQLSFIDVTREDDLLSDNLRELTKSHDGYRNWVEFVADRHAANKGVCPIIQINPDDTNDWGLYEQDLQRQFVALSSLSPAIGYRATAKTDSEFDIDLQVLAEPIEDYTRRGNRFYLFLDFGYVRPGTGELQSRETAEILRTVKEICPTVDLVLLATSFPKSVTDVDGEERGDFRLEEVRLHAETTRRLHNIADVHYGDYGSINPVRNDGITRGWRPRIDFPYKGERILYHREKRERIGGKESDEYTAYSSHYRSVAAKVVAEPAFRDDPLTLVENLWGIEQIRSAAHNAVPSSAAAFWISVRMNIHIEQQLGRIDRKIETLFPEIFG